MKIYNIILVALSVAMLFFTSCEPIEDRDVLENSFNPDDIELEVIQSTTGGNELTIKMNTPGVCGYWDYNVNTSFTDEVSVVYPIPGTSTFTYYVSTAYINDGDLENTELFAKTVDVTIDVLDHELPPAYYYLVGEDLSGKTWVFNQDIGPEDGGYWYMTAPNDNSQHWYFPVPDGTAPEDLSGSMEFNLDGAANYVYHMSSDDTEGAVGGFAFNSTYTKLTISGDNKLPGNAIWGGVHNTSGVYDVISLTADELVVGMAVSEASGDGWGWVWKFKPLAD